MKIICSLNNQSSKGKPDVPVFYLKPETALLLRNRPFYFPEYSEDISCNLNLVFKTNKVGKYIQEKFAATYYNEIGICLNFIAFDLLENCKTNQLPWEVATSFENSLPISNFINTNKIENLNNLSLKLKINDAVVLDFILKDAVKQTDRLIGYSSQFLMIKTGDLFVLGNDSESIKIAVGMNLQAALNDILFLNCMIK